MFFGLRCVLALNTVQCVDLGMLLDLAKNKIHISHEQRVKCIPNYIPEYSFLYVERSDNNNNFLTKVN